MGGCAEGVQREAGADIRTSDRGLRIIGPVPSPATNRLRPSVHTRREVWKSGISWPYVVVYSDEAQVLLSPNTATISFTLPILLFSGVFCDMMWRIGEK